LVRWTIESLPWDQFDAAKVNPDLLAYAKAASLVEANGQVYINYLAQLFPNDPEIQRDIERWGSEEIQHGKALRTWAEKADPSFDYVQAMRIYQEKFKFPEAPIRGSQAMELVARCAIETGTSSFYTAMRDAGDEPVFKELCRSIAGDEIRHYHLFFSYLEKRYGKNAGRWARLRTLLQRSMEVTDEELCFAYAAANLGEVVPEQLPKYAQHYLNFMANLFEVRHLKNAMMMMARAAGFPIKGFVAQAIAIVFHSGLRVRFKLAPLIVDWEC
jgi:rubrerythrin